MTTPESKSPHPQARALRVLAATLAVAPVFLGISVALIMPIEESDGASPLLAVILLGLVAAGWGVGELLGYRASPIAPGTSPDPQQQANLSLEIFQRLMIVRFVAGTAPIILVLALTFALERGSWVFLLPLPLGLVVLATQLWPTRRNVTRVTRRLEAAGARSYLPEAFGQV